MDAYFCAHTAWEGVTVKVLRNVLSVMLVSGCTLSASYAPPVIADNEEDVQWDRSVLPIPPKPFEGHMGLREPESFKKTLYTFIILTIATLATALLSVYIAKKFFIKPEESTRFIELQGNLILTLWWILIGWLVGGLVEELMYRALLITALQRVLGDTWFATTVAILIPGLIWAARHIYFKGAYGAVFMFFSSIIFGLCYILSKRNLWPNVFLHGLINSLGFINRY